MGTRCLTPLGAGPAQYIIDSSCAFDSGVISQPNRTEAGDLSNGNAAESDPADEGGSGVATAPFRRHTRRGFAGSGRAHSACASASADPIEASGTPFAGLWIRTGHSARTNAFCIRHTRRAYFVPATRRLLGSI